MYTLSTHSPVVPQDRREKRRVKCDEARPVCTRCLCGQRQCSYLEPPVGSYSWLHLLQAQPSVAPPPPPPAVVTLPPRQARSLDYFRHVVAPSLGGRLDSTFWTRPVMQLAMSEAAAMHGMLAISMLYEGFEPSWKGASKDDQAALMHYSHALRLIATEKDKSVVLILSILFTCIEFLRGDTEAAITHCRHGTILSNAHGSRDAGVSAVLGHLSVFPYFFASGEFPVPAAGAPAVTDVSTAAFAMDELLGRAIRLVRSMDGYRLGLKGATIPIEVWVAQRALLRDLASWRKASEALMDYSKKKESPGCALLLMRFLVCWVWTSIAPYREEIASDTFQGEFAQIVELARHVSQDERQEAKFTFGMGVSPLLHFVIIKCRHLSIRLAALELLRAMGRRRESLWDSEAMYAIGKCIIEREHGIVVTQGMAAAEGERLPDDESRIRDSYLEDEVLEERDDQGNFLLWRKMVLFVRDGEAISRTSSWISIPSQ
ncbi:C6 zinc finger domain-containing protein [Emericellopsis cladophorae]|uniref:C6 zinc finger domain-containing protein n=1 Tax=Emericellopsis cladophorae TaxID=2686198 RepID=A0A9P9Y6T2_9HYPO|nr:C6 zinc finger domain-containing protein [Emericellopsis cladophorae]KAI6784648.1 C6 zinc finger domain-containing protein [Emericellopsis cladophorae]